MFLFRSRSTVYEINTTVHCQRHNVTSYRWKNSLCLLAPRETQLRSAVNFVANICMRHDKQCHAVNLNRASLGNPPANSGVLNAVKDPWLVTWCPPPPRCGRKSFSRMALIPAWTFDCISIFVWLICRRRAAGMKAVDSAVSNDGLLGSLPSFVSSLHLAVTCPYMPAEYHHYALP